MKRERNEYKSKYHIVIEKLKVFQKGKKNRI